MEPKREHGVGEVHAIREFDSEGLVLLVLRGDKEIIPHGDTVLEAGDVLVILRNR